ncbi:MAG: hypothetical protein D6731_24335 [Planctomycetota bacterium]|nr:MAG: hypothetical protein D6731_24335 [Planctomycetota bacterium]
MSPWDRALVLVLLACCAGAPARAQDDDPGLGPGPGSAPALLERAVEAMGGEDALRAVSTAVLRIVPSKSAPLLERHSLRLRGRWMHYASRRRSGAGFDVVLAGPQAFLCDRDATGRATYVEDLAPADAREGGYERDILFMPLLLVHLLDARAPMDARGPNSVGDEVVRVRIPPAGPHDAPFVIRLRFDADTHLLRASMGAIPWGTDKGKKRYCFYEDYRPLGRGGILLPHRYSDQRGKKARPRKFRVEWELDRKLPGALFLRPRVEEKE